MSRRFRWLPVVALLALVLPMSQARTVSAQTPAACPTGATLAIAAPSAAAPSTVTVTVTPANLSIKAASAADANSFHLHYFVDTPAAAAGTVIPTGDAKIIHSATTTQDLGALAAGSHTVTVVLGQLNHTACDTRATVTFTTAAAAAAPAPAKTGNAGSVADGVPSVAELASLAAAALLLTAAARTASRRQR